MATLDDDARSARVVDEAHRDKRQLAQRPLLHWDLLQLGEPALRVTLITKAKRIPLVDLTPCVLETLVKKTSGVCLLSALRSGA